MFQLQRALCGNARWSERLISKQLAAGFSSTTGPSSGSSYECGLQYGMVVDVSSSSGPMDVIATPSSREDTLSIQVGWVAVALLRTWWYTPATAGQ
jgi:hypothetical protein